MNKVLNEIRKIPLGFYSQIFSLLLSLPTLVIITHSLEIDEYGRYSLIQRIAFCIGVIGSFGLFTSVAHLPEEFRSLKSTIKTMAFMIVLTTQLLLLYLISSAIHFDDSNSYSLFVLVLSNIPIMYFLNLFRGEGRELDFLICKVAIPAAYVLILIVISLNSEKLKASSLIQTMAYVQIGVLFILILLESKNKNFGIQSSRSRPNTFLKHSLSIWVPGIFVEARNFLEPMIVNQYTTPRVFGAYSFSLTVSSLPIFIGVYYSTFLPSKFKSSDIEPRKILKKILVQSFFFSVGLAGLTAIAATVLFKVLAKTYSENALSSTLLYLIIAPILSLNIIFLQYYLLQKKTIVNLVNVFFYMLAITLSLSFVRPVSSTEVVSIIGVASIATFTFNLYHLSRSSRIAIHVA